MPERRGFPFESSSSRLPFHTLRRVNAMWLGSMLPLNTLHVVTDNPTPWHIAGATALAGFTGYAINMGYAHIMPNDPRDQAGLSYHRQSLFLGK